MKEVYVISYYNGGTYSDYWKGILESEGIFTKREDADKRVKELQEDLLFKLNDQDDEDNWHLNPQMSWEVRPMKIQ